MFDPYFINQVSRDFIDLVSTPNALRSILILVVSLTAAYWLSRFLAKAMIRITQIVANIGDNTSDDAKTLRFRQIETYLSIASAVLRAVVVVVVGYLAWRALSPIAGGSESANSIAAIGAGTVFVVIAGQTIGIVLRDLTAGTIMIAERWFTVGDFIKVEPFWDVAGVVERFTLRSTRIRALNGEIIWMHNQHITGVHVTPRGVRTMAVDIFVRDLDRGEEAVRQVISAIPKGKMMLAKPLRITSRQKWGDEMWRITATGQTAPGREWLIQDYFVEMIKNVDEGRKKSERLLVYPPFARFADDTADRRFNRAVRVAQEKETK
ncbi:mechanosensitive ion channel family protein [Microbacteriaceae bacterium]|nr:mechanosensitive ion channel family protein [Candidatus Saccharibacteria bacterium]